MVIIKVQNVNEVERFLINLPKKIDKELTYTNSNFMNRVMKSAKNRAPVDTGSLRESIKLMPVRRGKDVKKWQLTVTSPYALFQEEGFTPHSFYAGGALNSKKMIPGRNYFVSKWTPFIRPALDQQIKTFPDKLNTAMGRAIKK
jgi:hypothetical protein